MPTPKRGKRKQRFGVLMDIKYKAFLWEQAARSHRSPVRYVEMLLERHQAELAKSHPQEGEKVS